MEHFPHFQGAYGNRENVINGPAYKDSRDNLVKGKMRMWWGMHSHGDHRSMKGVYFLLIFVGILLLSRGGSGFPWWFVLFFVLPMLGRALNAATAPQEEDYKRKRTGEDVIIVDKPKREPRYAVGDDGELVEVYADEEYDQERRRRTNADELEYF